ncbi:MAG: response regulator [Polyangiaceae bacterium]|jgi:FixJ family two-component response regulator
MSVAEAAPIVFVLDDEESVRTALATLVRSAGLRVEAFASAEAFLARPLVDAPSCLLLDVRLRDGSGLDLQLRLAELNTEIPIVFITGYGDVRTSVTAMKAGAIEFLLKPLASEEVLEAIARGIARHSAYRERQMETACLRSRYESLTPREREVMSCVVAGLPNKQVAAKLGIREDTIKGHRGKVMRKMLADSLADLVRQAEKLGVGR